ncbi:hypothetical protein [Fimbriiglobus ruber]|uniref:Uncharacterized protein n=1 Tax=Fimbriiglobus ruber TaxID=1908690 RepID=A0A225DGL5_9BACT|nr:hypothetical protein [Fimbriiglobus ruber]OWK36506.1 hypothetical protein FRUB_09069 [Fimbriiglobus ruber]
MNTHIPYGSDFPDQNELDELNNRWSVPLDPEQDAGVPISPAPPIDETPGPGNSVPVPFLFRATDIPAQDFAPKLRRFDEAA